MNGLEARVGGHPPAPDVAGALADRPRSRLEDLFAEVVAAVAAVQREARAVADELEPPGLDGILSFLPLADWVARHR